MVASAETVERIKEFGAAVAASDHPYDSSMINEFVQLAVGAVLSYGVPPIDSIQVAAFIAASNFHSPDMAATKRTEDALLRDEWLVSLITTELGPEVMRAT